MAAASLVDPAMTAANYRRSFSLGLLLVMTGSLTGLLLSEMGYRVARRYFVCLPGNPNVFVARSWGWTHVPGMSLRMHGCIGRRFEWTSDVAINTKGLRDGEVAYARTSAPRVLVLGDSITEGVQVDVEDTFVERAERILAEDFPGMEVINGGHAGFGNDNELAFYRAEGRRYAPDLVLLAFNIQNDILENSASLYHRAYAEAREQFAPKPTFDVTADGALLELPAPPARLRLPRPRRRRGAVSCRSSTRTAPASPCCSFPRRRWSHPPTSSAPCVFSASRGAISISSNPTG